MVVVLVRLLGVEGTQKKALELVRTAQEALCEFEGADALHALAEFIVNRTE